MLRLHISYWGKNIDWWQWQHSSGKIRWHKSSAEWVLIKDFLRVLVRVFRFELPYLCGANIDWAAPQKTQRAEDTYIHMLNSPWVICEENEKFIYNLDIYFCSIFLSLFIYL